MNKIFALLTEEEFNEVRIPKYYPEHDSVQSRWDTQRGATTPEKE